MDVTKYLGRGQSPEPIRAVVLLAVLGTAYLIWRGYTTEEEVNYYIAAATGVIETVLAGPVRGAVMPVSVAQGQAPALLPDEPPIPE